MTENPTTDDVQVEHDDGWSEHVRSEFDLLHRLQSHFAAMAPDSIVPWADKSGGCPDPILHVWVDVQLPNLMNDLGKNWIFEVDDAAHRATALLYEGITETTSEDKPIGNVTYRSPLNLLVPYDTTYHLVFQDTSIVFRRDLHFGEPLSDADRNQLDGLLGRKGVKYEAFDGWRHETISAALTEWLRQYSGRKDLVAQWDPTAPPVGLMVEVLKAAEEVLAADGSPATDE